MKRALLIALVLALVLPLVFLTWLGATESGLRWAYRNGLQGLPGEFRAAELSGTLAGTITLRGVSYSYEGSGATAAQIQLDWNPWALLSARFEVGEAHIESLQIVISEALEIDLDDLPDQLPPLELPLALELIGTRIDKIDIVRGARSIHLNRVVLAARADADSIEIDSLTFDAAKLDTRVEGSITPNGDYPHDLVFSWQAKLPTGAGIDATGRISGTLKSTRVTQQLRGAMQLEQTIELRDLLLEPSWQSRVDASEFDTSLIAASLPAIKGSLRASGQGDLNSARLKGSVTAEAEQLGAFDANFALHTLANEQGFYGVGVEAFSLSALNGELAASGQFDWSPELRWQADVEAARLNPAELFAQWPGELHASFATEGKIAGADVDARVNIKRLHGSLRNYPVSLQGDLHWRDRGVDIQRLEFTSGNTRGELSGRASETLALDWSLDSGDLAEVYPEAKGSLSASGSLAGQREQPEIKASFSGKALSLREYRVGEVAGTVALDLLRPQLFDIDLKARALEISGYDLQALEISADPGQVTAGFFAAQGSARIELSGEIDGEVWRGRLNRAAVHSVDFGDWNLVAPAALSLSSDALDTADLCLQNEHQSRICSTVHGQGQNWKIDLEVGQLPLQMLDRWMPSGMQTEGLVDASAHLDLGYPDRLVGEIDLVLSPGSLAIALPREQPLRLDYQSLRLDLRLRPAGLEASADMTMINGDRLQGSASLPGAGLLTLVPATQALQAELRGKLRDLSMIDALLDEVTELRGELEFELAFGGTLAQPLPTGNARLSDASLRLPGLEITLQQLDIEANSADSTGISYRANAQIDDGKLSIQGTTELNPDGGWPSEFEVEGQGLALPRLLEDRLPPQVRIDGTFDFSAALQYRAPDTLQGKLRVVSSQGTLHYPLMRGEIERWQYRDGELDLRLTESGVEAEMQILLGDESRFNGRLALAGAKLLALDFDRQALVAEARLDFKELEIIEALLPEIDKARGNLELSLEAAGTLAQPKLRASAKILEASVEIPRLGLSIEQITLQGATDDKERFNFRIGARSGSGHLTLEGNSLLDAEAGWPTRVTIKGENFEASRIPEAAINLSPDLVLELKHRSIDIQGDLRVPYARLQPKDISTATRVSNDVVVIGGDQPAEDQWQITARINLILGDRVTFFGFGFEGELGGNLVIDERPGQLASGIGEITIPRGRYRAYGQRLDIENGRLLFTGGPVTDPGLDIRATRTSNDVVAGLQARGRLSQPQIELFSIPAMGQTDTLSYLILGRPMEGASGEDGALMAKAALALGLTGGDRLARTIGDRFGLDEVRVESNDSGDQASLVVGRYLSPRLYVSYGVGLIESINSLNLRYQLSERWKLEAESGMDHGADLLFSIER